MTITVNKGEWSELYVLFKLFADNRIAAASSDLQPTRHFYNFLKVYRSDNPLIPLIYDLENKGKVSILRAKDGSLLKIVDSICLSKKTANIFEKIRDATDTTFSIVEAENIMSEFMVSKVKAKSSDKSDLIATLKDDIISETEPYGFSIKSQIGGASTLLNASAGTNFVYRITNLPVDIDTINSISTKNKVRDRLKAILGCGAEIDFVGLHSDVFRTNLQTVDTIFPQIVSVMIINYYLGKGNNMNDLCQIVSEVNVFGLSKNQIVAKMKNFLKVIALGMVPQTEWNTRLSSYGGYIVVRKDGVLVCYHLYNEDAFKDYLFDNTKFDTPSSNRHNFGKIYEKNGELFINLNLQIRFTS
ncbi:MAG: HpaII family restriction endonuclease [Rickettsiales bacterium]|jgi:type II restriction enzyme|nr:HpaII family restriction endonuclease [Rickettsiales bacterium]